MPSAHCIRGALTALIVAFAASASAQPEPGAATFMYFLRGTPIGSEQISVTRTAEGWTISSSGRLTPPIDAVARHIEIRYTPDWRPRDFSLEGAVRGQAQSIRTVVEGNTAKSQLTAAGQTSEKTDTIDPNAVLVLPTSFLGPFEAVAERLRSAAPGSEIPAYGIPAVAFTIRVGAASPQQIQTTARLISAKRTAMTLVLPGASVDADLWTDEAGRMIRLSVPVQALEVVREDVASVASRSVVISRPNDESIRIPSNGFTLAGTLSKPERPAAPRLPAVVFVGGSGPVDRDELVAGIPIAGQIAGALADAGFIAVRYDKRGVGQSGGRAESASFADYADDLRAAIRFLEDRKDVDPRRIGVIGHSEGGSIAMLAASKDKRIKAIVLLSTVGMKGGDVILAQQRHVLDQMNLSPEDKQAKIDLQKRIQDAVVSGKGIDQLPPDVRKQVDNAEFQSILTFDPARVMPDVRQPIFIVQGALDVQVEPVNAERLEALARARKNSPPVERVTVPGVNHLLVNATTGEVGEYAVVPDKHVSAAVIEAIVTWLKKTL